MSTNEMTSKVRELKELTRMKEELEAEMTAIEDEIKAEMNVRGADELIAGEYKVRWTTVQSNRFDTTAFKKAMPDLAAAYTKITTSRRFSIA